MLASDQGGHKEQAHVDEFEEIRSVAQRPIADHRCAAQPRFAGHRPKQRQHRDAVIGIALDHLKAQRHAVLAAQQDDADLGAVKFLFGFAAPRHRRTVPDKPSIRAIDEIGVTRHAVGPQQPRSKPSLQVGLLGLQSVQHPMKARIMELGWGDIQKIW